MSDIAGAIGKQLPMEGPLQTGASTISLDQVVTFVRYARLVLPLDGFVFWVKADLLRPSALLNASRFNTAALGRSPGVSMQALTLDAPGSLHYATTTHQDESAVFSSNEVIFTSEEPVQDLNEVSPEWVWIAEWRGVRFAFSSRKSFYRQAGLWHYRGAALYSTTQNQLVDKLDGFDVRTPVVSNSLPLWLALSNPTPFPNLGGVGVPLYPSFAVPGNLPPPYASIHIDPTSTRPLQSIPRVDGSGRHWQLAADRVRCTLYGLRNPEALSFLDYVQRHSLTLDSAPRPNGGFGLMNAPTVRDDKHTQPELEILSQKKIVDFEVSYYQTAAINVAQQLILEALVAQELT